MEFSVIFDWDGVIIQSEDLHRRSWHLLAAELGRTLPEGAFEASFGMRNQQIIPAIFRWAEEGDLEEIQKIGDRKEVLYRELIAVEGIEALPGVKALVDDLERHGVSFAVGSSTPRANIDAVMAAIGLAGRFHGIVAADDVRLGKPDPEVFLKAAGLLGRAPGSCVVIEDALVGIEAGLCGGFKTLAVATTNPAAALTRADAVHETLESVDVSVLKKLIGLTESV